MEHRTALNTQGLPYHRLSHATPRTSRWWRPLTMLLVAALLWIVSVVLFFAGEAAIGHWCQVPRPTDALEDPRNPSDVFFGYGFLALLIPVVVLAVRWGGGRRGTIHSVAGRFRWRLMWRAGWLVGPAFVVVNGGLFLLDRPDDFSAPPLSTWGWVALITVLIVPLQSGAEEYVFRGFIPQLLGTWLRSPLWGILLASALFVLGHGYDAWGLVDIGVFALCAAYLVWKSGGLELSIALHAANNVSLTLLAPLSPSSLHQGATDPWTLAISIPLTVGATWCLSRLADRELGLCPTPHSRHHNPLREEVRLGSVQPWNREERTQHGDLPWHSISG